jgi:hypothetical protein
MYAGRRIAIPGLLLATLLFAACQKAGQEIASDVKSEEAKSAATDAYIFAYPLVTMEYTRRVLTNVAQPGPSSAPMGQWAKLRSYPAVDNHAVTAPNADTYYTLLWIDVSKEPWVISTPDMNGRYFLLPMLDGWTTVFADPGTRVTGTKAQSFAITGPGWQGTLPKGVTEYKSATGIVWILGRIYCSGTPEDSKLVHDLQDKMVAVPLSSYGKPYTPPAATVDTTVDSKNAVREQVNALDGATYFKLFAQLLKTNPPVPADSAILPTLAKVGIVPGQDFDASKLDASTQKGIADAVKPAQDKIMSYLKESLLTGDAKTENGWFYTTTAGVYGTKYRMRALITAIGLGANRPQDAIYPTSEGPGLIEKFSGGKNYVIHFAKGQMPPAKAFWSITMYDSSYFFVPNPINRYTVSSRTKFQTNADGSVDVYLQNASPGKAKESNWLPAPKDRFILMMRLYWPSETPPSIIDGSWKPPEATEVKG